MATEIKSWQVLREDGKNIAWVNGSFVGVVSDEQVAEYQSACPTQDAADECALCGKSWRLHQMLNLDHYFAIPHSPLI